MPEKQKRNWKDPQTVVAAVSITVLLTLWNTFATHDRHRVGAADSIGSISPAATQMPSDTICATPTQNGNLGKKCVTVTKTRSS